MKADSNSHTGRLGVAGTQLIFKRLGWIFREQPIEDYGIDAHVEVVENNTATGQLIALQIKSGKSWFKEKATNSFIFRGKREHLEYWQKHSLPVIVVLYDDEGQVAYWQSVNSSNVQKTDKAWKLIIPFEQQINIKSLEKIKDFSKKLVASEAYTILSLKDVSHSVAKRYSANILLGKEYTKHEVIEIARKITAELKVSEYYRNDQVKLRWEAKEAQVIWLFLYLSLDDVSSTKWICRTQWISKILSPENSPSKLDGERIDDETIVDWNEQYGKLESILPSHKLTKEDYLEAINEILSRTKPIVNQAIKLTDQLTNNPDEANYLNFMSKINSTIEKLYFQSTKIGSAPTECSDLSQRFQNVMAFAHNIVLPFSEKSLGNWEGNNRSYLVNQAIKNYQKEFQRLEFELEKIQ
ncbi:DUF4365 domain-containing protein [Oscillatoria acuminata]|uniref:DUF4365 domain-containing protein n=1 Tax=Oscillatoria acuminata PCC 6304 TaxID=56110 RepID=K9TQB0_9CYAN|nr:DUF4365 domain-containing protein [Oscillatoria acuminata]AFY84321.1 hypothetical protein Oscil6304_4812 [Oscillatoria acuminata PCC 6304]